jgi:hypothetical protein
MDSLQDLQANWCSPVIAGDCWSVVSKHIVSRCLTRVFYCFFIVIEHACAHIVHLSISGFWGICSLGMVVSHVDAPSVCRIHQKMQNVLSRHIAPFGHQICQSRPFYHGMCRPTRSTNFTLHITCYIAARAAKLLMLCQIAQPCIVGEGNA